jgi:hypothetical protein
LTREKDLARHGGSGRLAGARVALLHHVRNARALVALLTSTSRDENQVGGNPPPNLPAARTSAN